MEILPTVKDLYIICFRFFFIGALACLAAYVALRYFFQKDKASLYYIIYTSLLLLYFILSLHSVLSFSFLAFKFKPLHHLFAGELVNLIFIFYFLFASSFLDAKKRYPRIDQIVMGITKVNMAIWIFNAILSFILPQAAFITILNDIILVLIVCTAVFGTVALIRHWTYLERFFVTGALVLSFSGIYHLLTDVLFPQFGTSVYPLFHSDNILLACVLIEQFTYAGALGYKAKRESNKVIALEKSWIKELEENKRLQDRLHSSMLKYQAELEKEVKERTEEVIRRNNELQEEKLQKGLEEYKRAAFESELKALRTQINPHFLFNCMNILSSFVYRDMKEEAMDFILKFSRLMRLVLENSTHRTVLVEKDIQALKLYVHLEAVRCDNSFEYEFNIDPALLNEDYKIPPLLLQPYVENAIKHGLINKTSGKRLLKVNMTLQNDQILCEISDNGVGREKATELKHPLKDTAHQSLGMKVTESRIHLLKELSYGNASIDVIDLEGKEKGTIIKILLPAG